VGTELHFVRPFHGLGPAHNHVLVFKTNDDADMFQDAATDGDFHSRFDLRAVHGPWTTPEAKLIQAKN
jgi:hypothetical protein